jgi:hypothetical protein
VSSRIWVRSPCRNDAYAGAGVLPGRDTPGGTRFSPSCAGGSPRAAGDPWSGCAACGL